MAQSRVPGEDPTQPGHHWELPRIGGFLDKRQIPPATRAVGTAPTSTHVSNFLSTPEPGAEGRCAGQARKQGKHHLGNISPCVHTSLSQGRALNPFLD